MKKTNHHRTEVRPVKAIRMKIAEIEGFIKYHGPDVVRYSILAALKWAIKENETL